MANTLDADLVVDVARETAVTVLQSRLAMLNAFSRDFGIETMAPRRTVRVPKATGGATAQTNATNFESGDSTLSEIVVSVDQYTVSFHLTNTQLQQGYRLAHLFEINLHVLANKIIDTALTPVTTANYGAATVTSTAANFDTDDLKTLWGAAKDFNQRNLVIDGTYYAQFLPINRESFNPGQGAYGFDRFDMNNRWTGAGTNVVGFVADPQALGLAAGLPLTTDDVRNAMVGIDVITLPDLGLSVQMHRWVSLASRTPWISFDCMFGAGAGDTSALKIITSA